MSEENWGRFVSTPNDKSTVIYERTVNAYKEFCMDLTREPNNPNNVYDFLVDCRTDGLKATTITSFLSRAAKF